MTKKVDLELLDPELLKMINAVTAKRPRVVLDHILQHGRITTDDLKETYGYNHPPRAARDVREQGIPLKTLRIVGPDGRRIAAYEIDTEAFADPRKAGGRRAFPKSLKDALYEINSLCALCAGRFPGRALQVDHRVPYEIERSSGNFDPDDFMLVCGSCNRAKSWSCESCPNWLKSKTPDICKACLWGSPESYEHIAMKPQRSLKLVWDGEDVQDFDLRAKTARSQGKGLREHAKEIIRRFLRKPKG